MELKKSLNFKKFVTFILAFFLTLSLSYAKKADKVAVKNDTQTIVNPATPKLKKILLDLIKQNEYMDDVLDEMKDSDNNLSLAQISSLDLTFDIIDKNLKRISLLTKDELIKMQPTGLNLTYAKTIFSHADKLDKKIYHAQKLVRKSLSKNSILRDAPNSRKTKKAKGKNLLQIIKEQKAIHKLAKNIKHLKLTSKKLYATSKWLFIVAK